MRFKTAALTSSATNLRRLRFMAPHAKYKLRFHTWLLNEMAKWRSHGHDIQSIPILRPHRKPGRIERIFRYSRQIQSGNSLSGGIQTAELPRSHGCRTASSLNPEVNICGLAAPCLCQHHPEDICRSNSLSRRDKFVINDYLIADIVVFHVIAQAPHQFDAASMQPRIRKH